MTNYHGHYNSIGSTGFADFRGGPTLIYPSMAQIAPTVLPASQMPRSRPAAAGPRSTTDDLPSSTPGNTSFCRGCPWDWTDAETDYSKVDAIEVQTGRPTSATRRIRSR